MGMLNEETIETIPKIEEFLQAWKVKARNHYLNVINTMIKLSEEYSKTVEPFNRRFSLSDSDKKNVEAEHKKKWDIYYMFQQENMLIYSILYPTSQRETRLEALLNREVARKKKHLIMRIKEKAGEIVDANGLNIGVNSEINGFIKGSKATVEVRTIYAGGYNIQCLHYRVLIHPQGASK